MAKLELRNLNKLWRCPSESRQVHENMECPVETPVGNQCTLEKEQLNVCPFLENKEIW